MEDNAKDLEKEKLQLRSEIATLKRELIDKAKAILTESGYYTDNLWSVRDVTHRFKCTDEEAQYILDSALQNEATMEQIRFAIGFHAEYRGYEEKIED